MFDKPFRNHILYIVEQFGARNIAVFWILIPVLINGWQEAGEIAEMLFFLGVAALCIVLALLRILWLWNKTWYTLDKSSITEEIKTLRYRKNTLSLSNISNINIEQNMMEMMLGIGKIKINTNSSSTADSTDLKIILRYRDAKELKYLLEQRMDTETPMENTPLEPLEEEVNAPILVSSPKDILLHAFYSLSVAKLVASLALFVTIVVGILELVGDRISNPDQLLEQGATYVAAGGIGIIIAVNLLLLAVIVQMVKSFVDMYGFSVSRRKDRIHVHYGLLKTQEYDIPVTAISSVIIHQTFVARVCRRYAIEVKNIGMGDEKSENTYLSFYVRREKLEQLIHDILPEYDAMVRIDLLKQSASKLKHSAVKVLFRGILLTILSLVVSFIFDISIFLPGSISVIVILLMILGEGLAFSVTGMGLGETMMIVGSGGFSVRKEIVSYRRIQRVCFYQTPLTKLFGLERCEAFVLAKESGATVELPYLQIGEEEILINHLQK